MVYYCPKGAKEGRPREDQGAPTWDQQPILTRPGQSTFFFGKDTQLSISSDKSRFGTSNKPQNF